MAGRIRPPLVPCVVGGVGAWLVGFLCCFSMILYKFCAGFLLFFNGSVYVLNDFVLVFYCFSMVLHMFLY